MTRTLRSAILPAIGCLVLTACGATSIGHNFAPNSAPTLGPCPRHVQTIRRAPTSRHHVRAFVPRDPIAAELCVYSTLGVKGSLAVLQASALLSAARAQTMTLMVDSRAPGPSCDGSFPVFMRLGYRSGQVLSALAAGCSPELLSTPTGIEVLTPTASLAVGGLLNPPLSHGGRVRRVFDFIGRRLALAALAAKQHLMAAGEVHVDLYELNDPGVPFGQVVWQTPLAGTEQDAASGWIGLVVATHRAAPCRAKQLLGRYANGGNATENHFGNIDLLDTSPQPCSVNGRLTLHGVGANGQPDTNTVSEPIRPAVVLSPRATIQPPAAALIATLGFAGNTTGAGFCYDHETTPTAWSLTLNTRTTLRIPNGAPGEGGPFYSCHGSLSFGLSTGVQLLGS